MTRSAAAWSTAALLAIASAPGAAGAADTTLAVLPLDKAAASETYDGLGTALAGMLITDLSTVPGLALVERERLDALLAETKLAESGFLDPKTAQKLGKGLGAELVVVGSFSVVKQTFLLDARIVKVETGRILQAAKGQGTVDDFVSVEKALVEGLLEGLSVKLSAGARRKLYVQAPTEKFTAFSAYGEGLAEQRAGNSKAARAAFERALALDPRFEAARTALGAMRSVVKEAKASARAEQAKFRDESHAKVMAAYPAELSLAPSFEDTHQSLAGFALRLMVLENEGRHCDRLEAMMHFLERRRWDVALPPRARGEPAFRYVVGEQAERHGFTRLPDSVAKNEAAKQSPTARAEIFENTFSFLFGDDRFNPHGDVGGVAGAVLGCYPPSEQLERLDALAARVKKRGKGHLTGQRGNFDVATALDLLWAWTHAKVKGANAALTARTKRLVAAVEGDADAKREMIRYVEHIVRMADLFEMHQLRRLGQSEATLARAMRGVAAEDPKVVRAEGPYCAYLVRTLKPQAVGWVRRWDADTDRDDVDFALDRAGPIYGSLRDMGCLLGQKARFSDALELFDLLAGIERYARPDKKNDETCLSAFQTAAQLATPQMRAHLESNPEQVGPSLAHGYLMTLHGVLIGQGCVHIDRR